MIYYTNCCLLHHSVVQYKFNFPSQVVDIHEDILPYIVKFMRIRAIQETKNERNVL